MLAVILDIIRTGVQQYGALFAVGAFGCWIVWYLLKNVVGQANKREDEQRQIISEQNITLQEHIKELKAHRRQTKKMHQSEMQSLKIVSNDLKQIEQALGRINGYKKPEK